ncbi:MAG: ABC transporter, partial [Gillisia sp.]
MKELKHVNKYFYKYKWTLILGLFITVVSRIFAIYSIQFIGDSTNIISQYIKGNSKDLATLKHQLLINILIIV